MLRLAENARRQVQEVHEEVHEIEEEFEVEIVEESVVVIEDDLKEEMLDEKVECEPEDEVVVDEVAVMGFLAQVTFFSIFFNTMLTS